MRGLPPWPFDFYRMRLTWAAYNGVMHNDFSIFAPGSNAATPLDLANFITAWATFAEPHLLALTPADASLVTCRLTTVGHQPTIVVNQLAPNHGAYGDTAFINAALCLTWRTSEPRVASRSHTLLPIPEELVTGDRQTLNAGYLAEAKGHAQQYLEAVNAIASPDGALCVAAVVHRSRDGEPLPASTWSPIVSADASPIIGTCARRVRKPGSPPPF